MEVNLTKWTLLFQFTSFYHYFLTIFSLIQIVIIISHSPGGVDYDYAKELGIHAKMYQGIPGKIAPKSSAEILYQYISKHI